MEVGELICVEGKLDIRWVEMCVFNKCMGLKICNLMKMGDG